MKKYTKIIKTVVLASTLLSSSCILADPSPIPNPNDSVVAAINQLWNNYITLTSYADASLTNNQLINIFNQNARDSINSGNITSTTADITNNLSSLPISILSTRTGDLNASDAEKEQDANDNLIYNLTTNTPASDTLYYNSIFSIEAALLPGMDGNSISKPKVLHDNYFNIDSVLAPVAYTNDQLNTTQYYKKYFTQDYNLPTSSLHLDKIKSKLDSLNAAHDFKSQYGLLSQLTTSPQYQQYQIAVRSNTAIGSIINSNINMFINERTPTKALASTPGIKAANGTASPLQVEQYTATHRVNDPAWYKHLQTATPENIQRETLMVLAEIESQNYQAHLDRERILATLTAQQASSKTAAAAGNLVKAQAVNQLIDSLTNSKDNGDASSGSN